MALFGEKCVRCGKQRTKREFEGLPTCSPCEQALAAKARAEGEETCSVLWVPLGGVETSSRIH